MTTVSDRLAERGLTLPDVAAPLASYVPALRTGNYVMTSGQLPTVDGKLLETGVVGAGDGMVSPERAAELAQTCALNALAAVASLGVSLDEIRVVKVVGFVASDPAFTGQPAVLNGASNLLGELLGEHGIHARSAVGVASLPIGAPVEVELMAEILTATA